MEAAWELHLYGDFRLVDPTGRAVKLPTVKVEALLAVLAAHRRYGIERDEIAEILWPRGQLDSQRANLRQALAQLRKSLAPHAIESSRSHCRLSDGFPLRSDLQCSELRGPGAFMPGHEGDWFEEYRIEPTPGSFLIDNFVEMLRWCSLRSSASMFSLLRSSPALARGIESPILLALVSGAEHRDEWLGWSAYWQGANEEDLGLCARLLRSALNEAERTGDDELASETCLELGKVYARTGRFSEADAVCKVSATLASRSRSKAIKANSHRLAGNVLVQLSAGAQGFEQLRRAEELIDDPVERAILQSGRAFYEASVGRLKDASETVAFPLELDREIGHKRIALGCRLTQALLAVHSGSRFDAVSQLESVATATRKSGSVQIRVYAEELLAKLFYLAGEKGLAQSNMRLAREGRMQSRMAVTPLEARRLQVVR